MEQPDLLTGGVLSSSLSSSVDVNVPATADLSIPPLDVSGAFVPVAVVDSMTTASTASLSSTAETTSPRDAKGTTNTMPVRGPSSTEDEHDDKTADPPHVAEIKENSTFTAEQAMKMAKMLHEKEASKRLQEVRDECLAKIQASVHSGQKECSYEIPIARAGERSVYSSTANTHLCEALIKLLEQDLAFAIVRRSSLTASRVVIRWNNDKTKDLSAAELSRRKHDIEAAHGLSVFSAYHARLCELETHRRTLDDTFQHLIALCEKRIKECIPNRVPSVFFDIPFVRYGITDSGDRNEIYDRLVHELTARGFGVKEQIRSQNRFKVTWMNDPEISVDEPEPTLPKSSAASSATPSAPGVGASSATHPTVPPMSVNGFTLGSAGSTSAKSGNARTSSFSTVSPAAHSESIGSSRPTQPPPMTSAHVRKPSDGVTPAPIPSAFATGAIPVGQPPMLSPYQTPASFVPTSSVGSATAAAAPSSTQATPPAQPSVAHTRAAHLLREYTQTLTNQMQTRLHLQRVQQHIQQLQLSAPPNVSQFQSTALQTLFYQHSQLLHRLQYIDSAIGTQSQILLRYLSAALSSTDVPPSGTTSTSTSTTPSIPPSYPLSGYDPLGGFLFDFAGPR